MNIQFWPEEPDHGALARARTGIILVNLGTPQAPTPKAVRVYLAEFLADPRIVELPRWLWRLILHGVILRIRPRRAARAYAKVWQDGGSPLMVNTKALVESVADQLSDTPDLMVEVAMRYGKPSIAEVMTRMSEEGVGRLIVVPLYPQYSASTTASVMDAFGIHMSRTRWVPDYQFVTSYHDRPEYIEALAASVRRYWNQHGQADRLLISFHGIPQRYFDAGDPYHCHCHKTARLLVESLGLTEDQWQLAFQSRFGREPWLQPYADETLVRWGNEGLSSVQVVCPGFAVDCLETLEEIAMVGKEQFQGAGGKAFDYIPALNNDPAHIDALVGLIRQRLAAWAEPE